MTKVVLFSTAILLYLISYYPSDENKIVGTWEAKELENSLIQVYRAEDGLFYGKIIKSDREDWVNEIILKETKYSIRDKTWSGLVYSLERKMHINVTINMESSTKLKLVGKKFFMTKTFYWLKHDS